MIYRVAIMNEKPECININGTKRWYLNCKLHREDGPAVEYTDGYKAWYQDGKSHREDGPAVVRANGTKQWFIKGKQVTVRYMIEQGYITEEEAFIELL